MRKSNLSSLCAMGMFTAILVVCSWISIPLPFGVPITLQTMAVSLAGLIFGAKRGAVIVSTYLLLGIIGLPVFAGFSSGIGSLFGLAGGFLWGFIFLAIFSGIAGKQKTRLPQFLWILVGIGINYSLGMFQYMFISSNGLVESLFSVVLPFLPAEIVKMVLAVQVGTRVRPVLLQRGILKP